MTYKLRLLTTGAFGSLTRMEQSLALDVARHIGMRSALFEADAHAAGAEAYFRAVVLPAAAQGLVDAAEREVWERACMNGAEAHDPRVRIFMVAWRERARTVAEGAEATLAASPAAEAWEMPARLGAA